MLLLFSRATGCCVAGSGWSCLKHYLEVSFCSASGCLDFLEDQLSIFVSTRLSWKKHPQRVSFVACGVAFVDLFFFLLICWMYSSVRQYWVKQSKWVYEHWGSWSFRVNLWSSCWSLMAGHPWEPTEGCPANDYQERTGSELKGNLFLLLFLGNLHKSGTTYIPYIQC